MKRSRFTEEQIIAILKEQECGLGTADLCRKHGISSATFYKWKAKYGGRDVSDARRLKFLEDENARLKKLLGEAMLDNAMLKDVGAKMVTPDAKRDAVAHACRVHGVSQRRACEALAVDRSSVRCRSVGPVDREREAMKAVAGKRGTGAQQTFGTLVRFNPKCANTRHSAFGPALAGMNPSAIDHIGFAQRWIMGWKGDRLLQAASAR